ncbi:MAG: hypothetical protein CMJ78_16550 [Planctomycetaceae bacterium]|nr:hypothetical protein [Planctomycetaceae bacterium]
MEIPELGPLTKRERYDEYVSEPLEHATFERSNRERINKVGPFDGHLTNSDAYDNPDVVYR